MSTTTLTWDEICALPWIKDIPAKIETNKHNKILMSPASAWHGSYGWRIGKHLDALLGGQIIMECPV